MLGLYFGKRLSRGPVLEGSLGGVGVMPSWIGWPELVVVAIIALIIFGPAAPAELGHSIGKAITGFRKGLKDAEQEVKQSVGDGPQPAQSPDAGARALGSTGRRSGDGLPPWRP